jgi:hypothetical protein
MAQPRRYRMNLSVGGVGTRDEIVSADPDLWASYIEAGWMTEVDDDGKRIVVSWQDAARAFAREVAAGDAEPLIIEV